MSDVEKYLEALRQRATLQPESGATGSVVSEAIICPTCKTPLNEQHQIGAGDRRIRHPAACRLPGTRTLSVATSTGIGMARLGLTMSPMMVRRRSIPWTPRPR